MWRRPFRALSQLSVLLGLGIVLLSARSCETRDNVWWCGGAGGRMWWVESVRQQLAVRTAAPWPAVAGVRWTSMPAGSDMFAVTAAGHRPIVRLSALNRPNPQGVSMRTWENTRLLMRVRYGPADTTDTGMLSGPVATNFATPVPVRFHEVLVPHWMVGLAAALPGLLWGLSFIPYLERKRRIREGLCAACGYDLTGNLSGVCPECGAQRALSISAATGDTVETASARKVEETR